MHAMNRILQRSYDIDEAMTIYKLCPCEIHLSFDRGLGILVLYNRSNSR